jgi:hypothetical protein
MPPGRVRQRVDLLPQDELPEQTYPDPGRRRVYETLEVPAKMHPTTLGLVLERAPRGTVIVWLVMQQT